MNIWKKMFLKHIYIGEKIYIIRLQNYNSEKMPYKKKSVHLEDSIHKKLKYRAFKKDSTIENVLNDILKKELKGDNK